MLYKIIKGCVRQQFDPESKRFVDQHFIAENQIRYEDEDKNIVNSDQFTGVEENLPYDMVQPVEECGTLTHDKLVQLVADLLKFSSPEHLIEICETIDELQGKVTYLEDSLYEVSE